MSSALSCLLLRRLYERVELFTDSAGKHMLIDLLKLPYTQVHTILDRLDKYPVELWSVGKLLTYSVQKEPFIHIDNDVFMWQYFPSHLSTESLVAQNIEVDFAHDIEILRQIVKEFQYLPSVIKDDLPQEHLVSCNAGIIGGIDHEFFQEFSKCSFQFINQNLLYLSRIDAGLANVIFEQYLFSRLAASKNQSIGFLFPTQPDYQDFLHFSEVPSKRQYVHLIGPYKKKVSSEDWIANRLRLEFPEYYYRIVSLASNFMI